jgi:hypothetical protein
MKIRSYLTELSQKYAKCVSKFGVARTLKCSCLSLLLDPALCCAVAVYIIDFGKKKRAAREKAVVEWFRYTGISERNQFIFTLPCFNFGAYMNVLHDEGILEVPLATMSQHKICRNANYDDPWCWN